MDSEFRSSLARILTSILVGVMLLVLSISVIRRAGSTETHPRHRHEGHPPSASDARFQAHLHKWLPPAQCMLGSLMSIARDID